MQQRTRGNGLDRFAEAHFVSQQRAFSEGQMQHAFALIWKERDFGFMRGPFAPLHAQLVVATQFFAFLSSLPCFQPRANFL